MKYPVELCPKAFTVHEWLTKATKLNKHLVESKHSDLSLQFNYDIEALKNSVQEILQTYNPVGWQTKNQNVNFYKSLSLRSNPNHQDNIDENVNSIGTPKNKTGEFFYAQTHNHEYVKDSYYDTFGFVKPTPCSIEGELGNLLAQIKPTIVRSRISTLVAKDFPDDPKVGWHRDESIFINLRLNIPLTTSKEFYFQMENKDPYNLKVGNLYTWDTNVAHKVFSTEKTDNTRTHLVIGCSPWFDYDPIEKTWATNKFFGVKHPFDMLLEGDILPDHMITL